MLFELKYDLHLDDSTCFDVCECLASYSKLCMVENSYVGFGELLGVLGSVCQKFTKHPLTNLLGNHKTIF